MDFATKTKHYILDHLSEKIWDGIFNRRNFRTENKKFIGKILISVSNFVIDLKFSSQNSVLIDVFVVVATTIQILTGYVSK